MEFPDFGCYELGCNEHRIANGFSARFFCLWGIFQEVELSGQMEACFSFFEMYPYCFSKGLNQLTFNCQ